MRGAAHRMQLTVGEVCLDTDKSAYFGVSARLTGCVASGRARYPRDLPLAKPSEKSDPGFKSSGIRGMSVDSFSDREVMYFWLTSATIPVTSSTKGGK
jgi:hypothetical protein